MDFDPRSPQALKASLAAAGFRRARSRAGYHQNGLCVTPDDGWLTVQEKADDTSDRLHDPLGKPGLWKSVVEPNSSRVMREFHLPLSALAGSEFWADDDQPEADPIQACLSWAAATARGEVPNGWTSPPREEVDSWVPHRGLVLQSGPLLRQGSLLHATNRLALCFPIVNEVPQSLSPARRDRIGEVLADAQNRWRMVRVGFDSSADRPAIRAEVDFSGAPHLVLEGLFRAGLDAVRCVVSWLLWPVAFLCDARVSCRIWEASKAGTARRKEDESS